MCRSILWLYVYLRIIKIKKNMNLNFTNMLHACHVGDLIMHGTMDLYDVLFTIPFNNTKCFTKSHVGKAQLFWSGCHTMQHILFDWPLGYLDLDIFPFIHLINCNLQMFRTRPLQSLKNTGAGMTKHVHINEPMHRPRVMLTIRLITRGYIERKLWYTSVAFQGTLHLG